MECELQGFAFQSTKSALVEPGSSPCVGELLKALHSRPVLPATDSGEKGAGLLQRGLQRLEEQGIAVSLSNRRHRYMAIVSQRRMQ
jgi:hypothetical protein